MKKTLYYTLSAIVLCLTLTVTIVACNKDENQKSNTESASYNLKEIDFGKYFQTVATMEHTFWEACDKAYKADAKNFEEICNSNDFEAFKIITGLDNSFFELFNAEVMEAQKNIEKDYPGICDQYRESPCETCKSQSLQKIGEIVVDCKGHSAINAAKLETNECIFICSMACMTTMELYIPCLLACTKVCKKITN